MEQDLSMQQITQAAAVIAPYVKTTPLIRAEKLEAFFDGAEVWLKLENLQHTGSFKLRGVANKMLSLTEEELARGVTAASSGNHAQAVSYMAAKLGTHAAIVMPENAPQAKVDGARGYGAEVIQYGFTGEDRDFKCNELIAQHGYSLVHSHVDPHVIAGHATAATEALGQMEGKVDAVVLPCGAGSLTSGAARAVKGTDAKIQTIAVEPAAVPRFTESLKAGHPVTVELGQTIADGLRVSKAEPINYRLIRDYVDTLLTIEEPWIARAVKEVALCAKIVAEPSACVGIAAALAGKIDTSAGRRLCFIITGGNVDAGFYADLLRN